MIEPDMITDTFSSRFASDAETSRVVAAPSPRSNRVEYSRIANASDSSPKRAAPSSLVMIGTETSPASSGIENPMRFRNEFLAIGPSLRIKLLSPAVRPTYAIN